MQSGSPPNHPFHCRPPDLSHLVEVVVVAAASTAIASVIVLAFLAAAFPFVQCCGDAACVGTDALMDAWMADSVLNANSKVAKWHESQQKCGFKFLVTQIMGYLTGGPQRYTGRPMEESHKHLAITDQQWSIFMADAKSVFQRFKLDNATQLELCGILSNYQSACVLAPGEVAPADPGARQLNT